MMSESIELCLVGKSSIFVEADWLEPSLETCLGLPVVRIPESPFYPCKFLLLETMCAPYHIAILPLEPRDPDCSVFAVIDRHGKLGNV